MAIDPALQALLDAPIGNRRWEPDGSGHIRDAAAMEAAKRASKTWLPQGRRPAPKVERSMHDMAESHARRAVEARRHEDRINKLLDYYATTSVPVERIRQHLNLTEDEVTQGLAERGRTA